MENRKLIALESESGESIYIFDEVVTSIVGFEGMQEERERHKLALSKRETPMPSQQNSYEEKIKDVLCYRNPEIRLPKSDLVYWVILFVKSCPEDYWQSLKLPLSACSRNSFTGAKGIFGDDIGLIFTSIAMWYGSLSVFNRIRYNCFFDIKTGILRR
jgi:hypothetical protein